MKSKKDLPKGWKDIILCTFREGGSKEKVLSDLGLTAYQHGVIAGDDEEYKEIFDRGWLLKKAHVHDVLLGNANGTIKGNAASAIFMAKNTLGWGDMPVKKEEGSVITDEIEGEVIKNKYKRSKNDEKKDVGVNVIN